MLSWKFTGCSKRRVSAGRNRRLKAASRQTYEKIDNVAPPSPGFGFLMSPLLAQGKKARVSPHETINATIDGDQVTVVYGRYEAKVSKFL
jgi:hypothetical protein